MARENAQVVSLAVALGVSNTVSLFNTFTPDLADVRKAGPSDTELVGDLRHGEWSTAVVALGVATAGSIIIDNWLPLIVSAALLAGLVVLYEYTLYNRPFERRATQEVAS